MKKFLALLFALLATPAAAQTIPSGAWGSINYWGVGGLSQVLAPGLAGQCLTTQNVGSAPIWVNCQVSSLSLLPSISANSIMANNTLNFVAPQAIDVNRVLDMVGYDIIRPPLPESIIYKSNVGPNFNWQTLPPGSTGQILTSGGPTNPPFWSPSPAQSSLASICQTVGAILYFDTPSLLWKCLNPGTSGQLLQTGGAAGNPSWLTVTLATLGGVPSTRNVNTSSPLGGGGALSADLTLTCPTCATTTNGGALSATAPETISAAGVIACATCATTTNGGALSATAPIALSAAGVISITSPLPIANGGTSASTQTAAYNALAPTPTLAGDITYWNGTNYVNLSGNNSGTKILQETSAGVPSWVAAGAGTVTSIAQGANTTANPGAGVLLSTNPCTATCTVTLDASYQRGYLAGCTLSTAGASATFGIAACVSTDSTNAVLMKQTTAYTKTTAAWAVGTATGSLDTGAIANNTWYHAYEISRIDTGVVDYIISLSVSAPTMPANYTPSRRIGSMKTNGSAQWTQFVQLGDEFLWSANTVDVNNTANSTTAASVTLTVPIGLQVNALFHGSILNGAAGNAVLFSSLDETDVAVFSLGTGAANASLSTIGSAFANGDFNLRTNTSAQIRIRSSQAVNGTVNIYTRGWIDTRGRNL